MPPIRYALTGAMFAVCGAFGSASAATTLFECRFPYEMARGGGWIPEQLILSHDDVKDEILAFDPVIKTFVGNPIKARLSGRTKARVSYTWEVKFQNKGQAGRMIYTFSYFSNGQAAKMKAEPGGFDNSWSGEGTCKVTKG